MSEWRIKSESDLDVVYAEYGKDGSETGNYRYETVYGDSKDIWVPGYKTASRWPVPVAAAAGLALGIASRLLPW